jgi:RNA polymerase sigma-70 factor (ECF subfamily)
MGTDDHRLALRCARDGDDAAFALLVERHREALVGYVGRRFGAGIAEDAVQEALVSAHRALHAGVVPDDVRAWLHTIALRRALDIARRQPDAAADLDRIELPDAAPSPEETAIMASELGGIVDAWAALPERQRSALAMSVLEGRSLDEIGDRLHVGPVAAKSLVARARRRLTLQLQLPAIAPLSRLRDIIVTQFADAPVAAGVKICAVACTATVALPSAGVVDPGPPPPAYVAELAPAPKKEREKEPRRKKERTRTARQPAAAKAAAPVQQQPVAPQPRPQPQAQAVSTGGGATSETIEFVRETAPAASVESSPRPVRPPTPVPEGATRGEAGVLVAAPAGSG